MGDVVRLQEMAAFLRSRRARIAPETVGFLRSPRRRAKGLRREEVADLAGVGITWYTWLEQGRDIRVSDDVLASIARALRLDADETEHLFSLARPPRPPAAAPVAECVPRRYQAVLDALNPNPAHIRDRRCNLLAWNAAFASATGFDQAPPEERNLLWLLFTEPSAKELVADWSEVAEVAVAQFRFESGPFLDDPRLSELLADLRGRSPEFCEWWSLYDVYSTAGSHTEWQHPAIGHLEFERCSFALDSADAGADQRLLNVLMPVGAAAEATRSMPAA